MNIENTTSLVAKYAINYIVITITNYYQNCFWQNLLFNYNRYKKYLFNQLMPGKQSKYKIKLKINLIIKIKTS